MSQLLWIVLAICGILGSLLDADNIPIKDILHVKRASNGLQDIVCFSSYVYHQLLTNVGHMGPAFYPYQWNPSHNIVRRSASIQVRKTPIGIVSTEFYRLPVPSLWLDIFQKFKAIGFNTVSFYVDWALLEGKPGHFTAEDVFAFAIFGCSYRS